MQNFQELAKRVKGPAVQGKAKHAKAAHPPSHAQDKLSRLLKKNRVKIMIQSRSDNDPDVSTR
ncbi:MAG: hypothetical protein ACE5NJ_00850, partial [Thermodesulfobacteriota bacterium]